MKLCRYIYWDGCACVHIEQPVAADIDDEGEQSRRASAEVFFFLRYPNRPHRVRIASNCWCGVARARARVCVCVCVCVCVVVVVVVVVVDDDDDDDDDDVVISVFVLFVCLFVFNIWGFSFHSIWSLNFLDFSSASAFNMVGS